MLIANVPLPNISWGTPDLQMLLSTMCRGRPEPHFETLHKTNRGDARTALNVLRRGQGQASFGDEVTPN